VGIKGDQAFWRSLIQAGQSGSNLKLFPHPVLNASGHTGTRQELRLSPDFPNHADQRIFRKAQAPVTRLRHINTMDPRQ